MSMYDEWVWKELTHWRIADISIDDGIDWCEPNWKILPFIAEFFNTTSILPALIAFVILFINIWHFRDVIESRFYIWLIAYIFSAIGGIFAHGTLIHFAGVIDEVILFINGLMFILIQTSTWNLNKINNLWWIALIIISIIWFFVLEIIPLPGFIVTVSGQIGVGVVQIWFVYKLYVTKSLFNINNFLRLYIFGWTVYSMAGICAICDIIFCSYISYSVLHSIWHILVGIASQILFVCVVKIRLHVLDRHNEIQEIRYFPFFFRRCESIPTLDKNDDITIR